ncbi:MAG: ABC transporter permease [Lachnospiraceae bacterium]|nr:ABC transporter permease [Lachnospiraceae bacterium]
MQVFKNYFRILKSYKGVILMYFIVFLSVAIVMSINNNTSFSEGQSFSATKLKLAIVDRDQQTLGRAVKRYFEGEHEFADVEEDENAILNELYWRQLDYVLVIPKGYEEGLLDADTSNSELECMKVPGNYTSSYFEAELQQYIAKLTGLLASGYSITEAEDELDALKEETVTVRVASFVNENQNDIITYFFLLVPYLFISLGTIGVGMILLRLNEQEVKDRMECSSTPLKERNIGLIGGIFAYGGILLLVVLVVVGILSKGSVFTDMRTPYFLLNLFAMLLFGLSLGFFAGTVAKNQEAISGIVNIAGLALCFLGGVFVPIEFFGDGILKAAKFFPTYWYVVTNETIGGMTKMTSALAKELLPQIGVVLGYALAISAVTLVIISNKRSRRG